MAISKVTAGGIADIAAAVEGASDSNKFTDADHSKLDGVAASSNNYVHPNHSGEVTSTADGATVIADDAVTAAKLANSINTDIATGVTGNTTANAALPKAGGAMTGTITGFTSTGIDDNATSTAITINAGENVGIGTSSPVKPLHITGAAGNVVTDMGNGTLLQIDGGSISAANQGVGLAFVRTGSQLGFIKASRENTSNEAGSLSFASQTSGGTHPESMRIDSAGQVTMPYQPSFRAYKTSTNTGGGLDWHGTYHNTGSHFSTSNGRFTAPVAGFYYISVHYLTDSDTTQTSVNLTLNGQANDGIRLRSASSSGHETTSASHVIYLNANDYILATFSGGSVYGDSSYSWSGFSGHLLG